MNPFVIGVDVWQGQGAWSAAELRAYGVMFFVLRLVGLDGILYKDHGFDAGWAQTEGLIRWPYIIYDPWSTPLQNFAFLCSVMPADATHVSIDIEVARSGLSPQAYSQAVFEFISLVGERWSYDIYSANWFLPNLSLWPGGSYWWARYPAAFYPRESEQRTWEQVKAQLELTAWEPGKVPGDCNLWQFTGDRLRMPGAEGVLDISAWYGTLEELEQYAGFKKKPLKTYIPIAIGDPYEPLDPLHPIAAPRCAPRPVDRRRDGNLLHHQHQLCRQLGPRALRL